MNIEDEEKQKKLREEIKNINVNDYKRYQTVILTINTEIKDSKMIEERLKALSYAAGPVARSGKNQPAPG